MKWEEQYSRVKRYYDRIKCLNNNQIEYEDDLWAFFQNCYHLKDWIKNGQVSQQIKESIENKISTTNCTYLPMCADLANRTKHSTLDKHNRVDAEHTNTDVTINAPSVSYKMIVPCCQVITSKDEDFISIASFDGHNSGAEKEEINNMSIDSENSSTEIGSVQYTYWITANGTKYKALDIAQGAIEEWDRILHDYNLI